MSKTNPILSINLTPEETIDEIEGYREIIKENIEYDSLLLAHPYIHLMSSLLEKLKILKRAI